MMRRGGASGLLHLCHRSHFAAASGGALQRLQRFDSVSSDFFVFIQGNNSAGTSRLSSTLTSSGTISKDNAVEPSSSSRMVDMISGKLGLMEQRIDSMNQNLDPLHQNVVLTNQKLVGICERLDGIEGRLAELEYSRGLSTKRDLRQEVSRQYGNLYSKQEPVRSIYDLVALLPADVFPPEDEFSRVLDAGVRIASILVEQGAPDRFLKKLYEACSGRELVDEMELTNINTWNLLLGPKDVNLLERVIHYIESSDKISTLAGTYGLGLTVLLFETNPKWIFGDKITSYSDLDFDMRGHINLFHPVEPEGKLVGTVEIGECDHRLDFNDSKKRFGLRLAALDWVITRLFKGQVESADIIKIGRLFVPKSNTKPEDHTHPEDFTLYVHPL